MRKRRDNALAGVSVTHEGGLSEDKELAVPEVFLDVPSDGPVVELGASFGLTVKLRDFESAKVGVWASMNFEPSTVQQKFPLLKEWLKNELRSEVEQINRKKRG